MTLAELSDVSQAFGAVAVVASLIFVGIQIRQNTRALRANSHHAVTDSFNAINALIISDPRVAHLWRQGLAGWETLDEDERMSVSYMFLAYMRIFETLHYQFSTGVLEPKLFEAELNTLRWAVANPASLHGGPLIRSRSAPNFAPSSTVSFVRRRKRAQPDHDPRKHQLRRPDDRRVGDPCVAGLCRHPGQGEYGASAAHTSARDLRQQMEHQNRIISLWQLAMNDARLAVPITQGHAGIAVEVDAETAARLGAWSGAYTYAIRSWYADYLKGLIPDYALDIVEAEFCGLMAMPAFQVSWQYFKQNRFSQDATSIDVQWIQRIEEKLAALADQRTAKLTLKRPGQMAGADQSRFEGRWPPSARSRRCGVR